MSEIMSALNAPAFFLTSPHSGEEVPPDVTWLQQLDEKVLMCDVDRYVDQLYQPAVDQLKLPFIKARWHRYVVDLNRFKEDVDQDSVQGAECASGTHPKGLHWSRTTQNDILMSEPMSLSLHEQMYSRYYLPFHRQVEDQFKKWEAEELSEVYHLDAHSMPSLGTSFHRDPGERRAQIVVSDVESKSCSEFFKDLVISAYEESGFEVAYNWPYLGGRVTERYGDPSQGRHSIQVEINRSLYMDEETKKLKASEAQEVQMRLCKAVEKIYIELQEKG